MNDSTDDLEALFDQVSGQRDDAILAASAVHVAPVLPESEADAERMPEGFAQSEGAAQAGESGQHVQENQADIPMYDRLGSIVRQLHDSLSQLGYDRSLADVAVEVTDAAARLEYIATLTEKAANKVLNSIDDGMPVQDLMIRKGRDIEARWNQLFEGKLGIDEFKLLASDSRLFAAAAVESGEAEKARLMEIMMAQDFQDITGQIIKKIIGITQKLERELAQLLRDNAPAAIRDKPVDLLAGPAHPASAMGQNDVDDLLGSLGF